VGHLNGQNSITQADVCQLSKLTKKGSASYGASFMIR
jgi:hypothetical protein